MKKAQISVEIMYAVGVMIIIFIILSGISFNRRIEIIKLDDFLDKKNECLRLSDIITGIQASGNETTAIVNIKYPTDAYTDGALLVKGTAITPTTVEASCTYHGTLSNGTNALDLQGPYRIKNANSLIKFEKI